MNRVIDRANVPEEKFDVLNAIMAYEEGGLSRKKTIELFQVLVNTGQILHLQGSYGRMAKALIDQGLVIAKR